MKQKKLFTLFLYSCFFIKAANAQFYNYFKNLSSVETESAAIELNNGFIFGFTESNSQNNFHENILLIKTTLSGNIIWSKRYDAGTGVSLHLIEMIRTANNEILIAGSSGPDNRFYKSDRCILKINSGGNIIWAKKYSNSNAYDSKGLVELKDSSFVFSLVNKNFPVVMKINKAGNIISQLKINNRQFNSIHSITAIGDKANVVVGDKNIVTINFKTGVQSKQKQYNTSGQFTALLSVACKNGDLVYLAGRNEGGLLKGSSRIFRTSTNGDLLWAKNIDAFVDSTNSIFSRFDIVSQVAVHEDIKGNIVAVVQAESTQNLVIVFNAAGKYLYHRLLYMPYSFIKEISDGSYLHCAPSFNNISGNTIVSNRFLSNLSECDSTIFVKITNGTDSATTPDKLTFSNANIIAYDIPVTVKNTNIQTNVFCDLSLKKDTHNKKPEIFVTVVPNPATTSVIVKTAINLTFNIYSIDGTLKRRSVTNHSTDISNLKPGVYIIDIITKSEIIRKMMIKK